jgi:hypothetical protein
VMRPSKTTAISPAPPASTFLMAPTTASLSPPKSTPLSSTPLRALLIHSYRTRPLTSPTASNSRTLIHQLALAPTTLRFRIRQLQHVSSTQTRSQHSSREKTSTLSMRIRTHRPMVVYPSSWSNRTAMKVRLRSRRVPYLGQELPTPLIRQAQRRAQSSPSMPSSSSSKISSTSSAPSLS